MIQERKAAQAAKSTVLNNIDLVNIIDQNLDYKAYIGLRGSSQSINQLLKESKERKQEGKRLKDQMIRSFADEFLSGISKIEDKMKQLSYTPDEIKAVSSGLYFSIPGYTKFATIFKRFIHVPDLKSGQDDYKKSLNAIKNRGSYWNLFISVGLDVYNYALDTMSYYRESSKQTSDQKLDNKAHRYPTIKSLFSQLVRFVKNDLKNTEIIKFSALLSLVDLGMYYLVCNNQMTKDEALTDFAALTLSRFLDVEFYRFILNQHDGANEILVEIDKFEKKVETLRTRFRLP